MPRVQAILQTAICTLHDLLYNTMSAKDYHFPSEFGAEGIQFRETGLSDLLKTLDILADSIRRATRAIYMLVQQLIIWLTVLLTTVAVLTQPIFLSRLEIDKVLSLKSGHMSIVVLIALWAFGFSISLLWRLGMIFLITQRAIGYRKYLVDIIAHSSSEPSGNEYS